MKLSQSTAWILTACSFVVSMGLQNIQLHSVGYNFYADILFTNDSYTVIIDTGNSALTLVNPNVAGASKVKSNVGCLGLFEDGTYVNYFANSSFATRCVEYAGFIQIGESSMVNTSITAAQFLDIENENLHNWNSTDGDFGLSYCYYSNSGACPLTAFQQLLINSTTNLQGNDSAINALTPTGGSIIPSSVPLIFGIDINTNEQQSISIDNNVSSFLQLGSVSPQYTQSMSWFEQPTTWPIYHQFFMQDLSMCGVDLMGTLGSNWQAIVDTGQVCLQLPNEFYNSLVGWLDATSDITDASLLPAISFKMIEYSSSSKESSSLSSGYFYIPLAHLVIDPNTLDSDAPKLTIGGVEKQLCILQSGQVSRNSKTLGPYSYPLVVLGTMALNAIYFAADFSTGSVGLSSKLNETQAAYYATGPASTSYCQNPARCIGDQSYDSQINTCNEPSCVNYFFVTVDTATQTCHFTRKAIGWGLFFIIAISMMEIISFFTMQHTTFSFYRTYLEGQGIHSEYGHAPFPLDAAAGGGGNGAELGDVENDNVRHTPPQVIVKLDIVSRILGPIISKLVDMFIVHILGWAVTPNPHHRVN